MNRLSRTTWARPGLQAHTSSTRPDQADTDVGGEEDQARHSHDINISSGGGSGLGTGTVETKNQSQTKNIRKKKTRANRRLRKRAQALTENETTPPAAPATSPVEFSPSRSSSTFKRKDKAKTKTKNNQKPNPIPSTSNLPPKHPSSSRTPPRPLALNLLQRSRSVPCTSPPSSHQHYLQNQYQQQRSPFTTMGSPPHALHHRQHTQPLSNHRAYQNLPNVPLNVGGVLQPRHQQQTHAPQQAIRSSQIPRPMLARASSERPAMSSHSPLRHQAALCLPQLRPEAITDHQSVVSSLPEGSIEPVTQNIATTLEARAQQLRQLEAPFVPPLEICIRASVPSDKHPVLVAPPTVTRVPMMLPPTPIPDWLQDVVGVSVENGDAGLPGNNENVKPRGVFMGLQDADDGAVGDPQHQHQHQHQHPLFQQTTQAFIPSPPSSPNPRKNTKQRNRLRLWRQSPQSLSPTQVEDHPNLELPGDKHHERICSNNDVERLLTQLVLQQASDTEDDSKSLHSGSTKSSAEDSPLVFSTTMMTPTKKTHRRKPSAGQSFKALWNSFSSATAPGPMSPRKPQTLQRSATGCLA